MVMGAEEDIFEIPDDEVEDEVEKLRIAPSPLLPSAIEVEEHRITHYPYRSWCKFCAMCKSLGEKRPGGGGRLIHVVGVDYFFITSGGLKSKAELELTDEEILKQRQEGKLVKCLIVRCYETRSVFVHVVPCKGIDDNALAVELIVEDVAWLGHTRLLLKADNEKALQALARTALLRIKVKLEDVDQASPEMPQTYDSQSNGGTEVGVRNIRKDFRCLRMDLEERLGRSIPVNHPILAWLLRHVAFLQCILVKGDDGLTPWTRVKGRPFALRLTGFAERVFWKLPGKGPGHQPDGNMAPTWGEGVFLGYSSVMNSYLVATKDGVKTTRAMMRRPMEQRYSTQEVEQLKATPWSIMDKPETTVTFEEAKHDAEIKTRETTGIPRRFRINLSDLREHGFTDGCEQCDWIIQHGVAKGGLQHNDRCRARIMAELSRSVVGQQRLQVHEDRVTEALAKHVEKHSSTAQDNADGDLVDPFVLAPGEELDTDELIHDVNGRSVPMEPLVMPESAQDLQSNGDDSGMDCALFEDEVVIMLIDNMSGSGRSYKREKRSRVSRVVSEIYSPPRVTKLLSSLPNDELIPGFALDLSCTDPVDGLPWDFNLEYKQERARRLLRRQRPLLLVGSPECKAFTTWQALNKIRHGPETAAKLARAKKQAIKHLEFVVSLYREQLEHDRYFLHEHPKGASSWQEECIANLLRVPGVERVVADQCQYGAEVTYGARAGCPVMKPTGFMSNSGYILRELRRRCDGHDGRCSRSKGGTHVRCEGRVAREAAK